MFPTNYRDIQNRIDKIDPEAYSQTRNFIDGAVTRLSPYISRGVISTKQVFQSIMKRGFNPDQIEKFIQELAWRDYWQQVWIAKGEAINEDLRRVQPNVLNYEMPKAIVKAKTGIQAIDDSLKEFYESGYLHNHVRMYVASISCNVGGSHWLIPAKWMYYHLLDGDWASNALSWQWVSGANAGKEYYANQSNINKYCYINQYGTFLDVEYEGFHIMDIPDVLRETITPLLKTPLQEGKVINIDTTKPTLIYNFYNLDPEWHREEDVNRVFLLEPSIFKQYPVSKKSIDFALELTKNIEGIQVFIGEFQDLADKYGVKETIFKEHPLNNYIGTEESRDWMFSVKGYFPSFFAFWKKCKKELKHWNQPELFE